LMSALLSTTYLCCTRVCGAAAGLHNDRQPCRGTMSSSRGQRQQRRVLQTDRMQRLLMLFAQRRVLPRSRCGRLLRARAERCALRVSSRSPARMHSTGVAPPVPAALAPHLALLHERVCRGVKVVIIVVHGHGLIVAPVLRRRHLAAAALCYACAAAALYHALPIPCRFPSCGVKAVAGSSGSRHAGRQRRVFVFRETSC
jgi:hypothetical protein